MGQVPGSGQSLKTGPHAYPIWAPDGICMGLRGQSGLARMGPTQINVQAQSNSVPCQDWGRTGQTGLALKSRTGPGQPRYLGFDGISHLLLCS